MSWETMKLLWDRKLITWPLLLHAHIFIYLSCIGLSLNILSEEQSCIFMDNGSWTYCYYLHITLVTFSVMVTKPPIKSSISGEWVPLAHSSRVPSIIVEESWRQEVEQWSHWLYNWESERDDDSVQPSLLSAVQNLSPHMVQPTLRASLFTSANLF